jgi:hypothetical protein
MAAFPVTFPGYGDGNRTRIRQNIWNADKQRSALSLTESSGSLLLFRKIRNKKATGFIFAANPVVFPVFLF